ncbi:hypothetical protein Herbaro_09180 [Herbaspirillum sp. WKF16]|uniref:hypothetical protein n=1 Tax=Herbaspirillum sp. WKF16 TaxID=3028312 RepID=UPI0023A929B7|nr:hypothetical protein [Herbaspirillum sp. WKF16]WDZ97932.1 hypothetical protein Herbaro_09180 [Herbaspirillum sp. WKF16]
MRERPILFSAPMVRALLAGEKTQTRRIVKPQPLDDFPRRGSVDFDGFLPYEDVAQWSAEAAGGGAFKTEVQECPHGTVGDRLWVREAFSGPYHQHGQPPSTWNQSSPIWHWADGNPDAGDWTPPKPSIHMPRWASRILLEITGVRVERLQDISEQDALAEGIEKNWTGDPSEGQNGFGTIGWVPDCGWINYMEDMDGDPAYTPRDSFRSLWQSINGRDSWAANPWLWVVEFRRIEP